MYFKAKHKNDIHDAKISATQGKYKMLNQMFLFKSKITEIMEQSAHGRFDRIHQVLSYQVIPPRNAVLGNCLLTLASCQASLSSPV